MNIDVCIEGPAKAPVLVLSNSLGTTYNMWDKQLPQLTQHFRVLRYNTRGHSRSYSLSEGERITIETLAKDVIALLDHFSIEKAYFCGISLGGLTGMWLNRHFSSRFHRFVIANTAAKIGTAEGWLARAETVRAEGMLPIAATTAQRWFTQSFIKHHAEEVKQLEKTILHVDPFGYAACCEVLAEANMEDEISLMSKAMLVIAGEFDPVTNIDEAQFIVNNLPEGQLDILPASHLSNIACADEFTSKVLTFFDKAPRYEATGN